MAIHQVIKLWQQSKYNTLMLTTLPVVNHKGEITYGTGVYNKGQTIISGREYTVEEYLQQLYKDYIYILDEVSDSYLSFKAIYRKEVK